MSEKPVENKETIEGMEKRLNELITQAEARAAKAEKALELLKKKKEPKPILPPPVSTETKQPPTPPTPPDLHADHGHEEGKPHYIGAWQQFCPTCGDKNPNFKDETECEDCHTHLGSKEVAEKLRACPNCGGHRAKKL